MKSAISTILFAVSTLSNAAVYKCETDGRTVYTDQPCHADAEAEDLEYSQGGDASGSEALVEKNQADMKALMEERQLEAKIRQLWRETNLKIKGYDREILDLKVQRGRANNNLAGATYGAGLDGRIAKTEELREQVRLEAERREFELRNPD